MSSKPDALPLGLAKTLRAGQDDQLRRLVARANGRSRMASKALSVQFMR
jgi:hypothetical protein